MGWQEDLARTNDPYLMTPAAVRKSAAASNRARKNRNIVRKDPGEDVRRGFAGDLAQMGRDLSGPVRDSGFVKDLSQMGRDLIVDPVKKYLPGMPGGIQRGLASLTNNWEQNEENERILGGAYSDDVRKEMMSPSDRAFYEKYMRIGDSKSGQEADYYYDEARKALENAQVTRRVNYALGDLGFDTSAEAGVAAFGEDRPVVDYGGLSERLQSGLQGTKGGREFLSDVIPKGEALRGTGMIGDAADRIAGAQEEGRAGFATPEVRQAAVFGAELPLSQPELMDVTQSAIPQELFIDELQHYVGRKGINEQRKGYSPETAANMQGYLYGEPGALFGDPAGTYLKESSGSPYDTGARSPLYGIYPNYPTGNPIFDELEDMDEQELLDWGALNPNESEVLGFNPYYSDRWGGWGSYE